VALEYGQVKPRTTQFSSSGTLTSRRSPCAD
jgi:hypothetical protein